MNKDFDKLRKKTGIDELETQQRKKLFKEFMDHGGKIINEKKTQKEKIVRSGYVDRLPYKKGAAASQRPKQRVITKPEKKAAEKRITARIRKKRLKRKKVKIRDLLGIYIRGLVLKVFTAAGNRFSDNLIKYINKQIKESFLDLNITIGSFLKGSDSIKENIHRLSTSENSTFYEFLVRLSLLYNENEFISITKVISNKSLPKPEYVDIFKQFFKRIYILGQFPDLCKLYIDKSIDIQGKKKTIKPEIIPSIKAQLKKDINILLGDFLFKFHIILCKLARTYYPLYSQNFDDFLEITEKDKIGYITREEKKKRIEELKRQKESLKQKHQISQDTELEKEEIKVPRHVERGFPLLEKVIENFEKLHISDKSNSLLLMDEKDKMYKSIIFFNHFEDQYSFILTTSKISFNIDYREQKKIDIKGDLNNAYLLLSEAREELKNYLEIIKEIKKTNDNIRLTGYQKRVALDSLENKQSVVNMKARRGFADVMKTIENVLSIVITDYNSSKRFLQNPDEALYFDRSIDGEKRLHGKKIIEAIIESFLFVSCFAFLLNFGELSGSGLFIKSAESNENLD